MPVRHRHRSAVGLTLLQFQAGLATSNQWKNCRDHERVALAGDVVLSYLLSCLTTTAHFFEVHFEGLVQQGLCFHLCDPLALLVALLVLSLLVLKESLLRYQVSLHPPSCGLFALQFFLLLHKDQGVRKAMAP